jgi:hypothetical protein
MQQQTENSVRIVQIDSHAATTLRYIRASMEAAASLAVPGSAGIAMGIVGLLASVISSIPNWHQHWLGIWLAAAIVAAGLGGTLLTRQSSLRGLTLAGTPLRKFTLCLVPGLFGGAVMTAVNWSYGSLHAIPGTWLLVYGCALIAASAATTRTIGFMGGLFAALGLLTLALPDNLQMLMLGAGFGALHLIFGLLIGRMDHGR